MIEIAAKFELIDAFLAKQNKIVPDINAENTVDLSEKSWAAPDELMISAEFRQEIMETLLKIKDRVDSKNDISCINAIILVFETVDQLDFLNKRAIFVYVRDISGLNSKQLSAAMSSIRKLYREIKNEKTDLF